MFELVTLSRPHPHKTSSGSYLQVLAPILLPLMALIELPSIEKIVDS